MADLEDEIEDGEEYLANIDRTQDIIVPHQHHRCEAGVILEGLDGYHGLKIYQKEYLERIVHYHQRYGNKETSLSEEVMALSSGLTVTYEKVKYGYLLWEVPYFDWNNRDADNLFGVAQRKKQAKERCFRKAFAFLTSSDWSFFSSTEKAKELYFCKYGERDAVQLEKVEINRLMGRK